MKTPDLTRLGIAIDHSRDLSRKHIRRDGQLVFTIQIPLHQDLSIHLERLEAEVDLKEARLRKAGAK